MEIPVIAEIILEMAWKELVDADYDCHAKVVIGNDFLLVDKEEYEELRNYLESINSLPDRTRDRNFEDVVNIKEED